MAEETFKQIVEVEVNNDDAIQAVVEQQKAIDGLKKTISDLKKQQKELDTTTKEGARAYDENAKMIVVNEAQLKTLNQTMNANKRIVEANTAGTNEQTGAYQRLIQQHTALAQKANDLATVYGKNNAVTIKAQQEAKALSDRILEIGASVGQNQRNVGNYTGALEDFKGSLFTLIPGFGGMEKGLSAVTGGIVGMIKSSLAFIATPFGAVLTAIVVVMGALKEAFTSSEEGQNAWNKVTTVASALLGNFTDLLAKLGDALIWVFTNPKQALMDFAELVKQNIINRFVGMLELFPAIGKAIKLVFEGEFEKAGKVAFDAVAKVTTGVDGMTDKIQAGIDATKAFTDELSKEAKEAQRVADMRAKADKIERELLVKRADIEAKIADLRLKAKDAENYSEAERAKFLKQAQALNNNIYKQEEEALRLKYEAQKLENTFSRTNKENMDKEAQALAALSQAERNRLNANREMQEQVTSLNNVARQKEIAKTKEEQDKMFAEMEMKQKMYNAKNRELTAETALANFNFEKEQLDKKLEYGKVTQEEYDLFLLESKNKYQDATLKIVEAGIAKEKAIAEKIKNQEAIDFANKLELAKGNFDLEFQLKAEQREMQRLAEIEEAKKVGADVELINEKYRQAELQAEQAKNDAKIAMYSQAFGALATIAGENTQLSKGFASAQIAIDTYMGAMKAFNSVAGNPILGGILAGEVVVKGAKAIKDVWKVKNGQKSVSGGGGGGGNVNVSQGMAQRNAREMPSEAIQRTQKTEPTIVPVLVTNNLTEKIDTKVQVTNNASM